MAQDISKVAIKRPASADGVLHWLPANATVDSDPMAPLPPEAKSVGFIANSGITFADGMEQGEAIRAYGKIVVINAEPSRNPAITFTLLQLETPEALALAYSTDSIVTTDDGLKVIDNENSTPRAKCLIFDFALKDGKRERKVFRNCEFASRGDRVIDDENPDSIEVTWSPRVDSDGNYSISQVAVPAV